MNRTGLLLITMSVMAGCSGLARAAIEFTNGHFYAASYASRTIDEYDAAGAVVGSMTLPSTLAWEFRGIAFGPDGLLYAVSPANTGTGFSVFALDSTGDVQATYGYADSYLNGNISTGKITFDGAGHFWVSGPALVRFEIGNTTSGTAVPYGSVVYDLEPLPGGNLLIVGEYNLSEISPSGAIVRDLPGGTNYRGVEYNPVTNTIFTTELGHTGAFFQLRKRDGATGSLLDSEYFWYGDDMFLASDGRLIVGSRTQAPGIFSQDLSPLGALGSIDRMFVTQYTVPEPASIAGLAVLLLGWRRSRGARQRTARVPMAS